MNVHEWVTHLATLMVPVAIQPRQNVRCSHAVPMARSQSDKCSIPSGPENSRNCRNGIEKLWKSTNRTKRTARNTPPSPSPIPVPREERTSYNKLRHLQTDLKGRGKKEGKKEGKGDQKGKHTHATSSSPYLDTDGFKRPSNTQTHG